jgi:SAM-dependent methyltransferase
MTDPLARFPPEAFTKEDPSDDREFYVPARLVTHIDAVAIAALTAFYRSTLPAGGVILDLMSSWVSHLPDVTYAEVIGHGMNAEELAANPRLDRWFLADLNRDPTLHLASQSCDAALCCVGAQYLQRPVEVLAEVARILRPDSPFIVSFSNRCFPTKAVAIWRALDARGHARLIGHYMDEAGFDRVEARVLSDGSRGDPLTVVVGRVR